MVKKTWNLGSLLETSKLNNRCILSTNQYTNHSEEMHLETASYEDLLKTASRPTIERRNHHQVPFDELQCAQAIMAVDAYVQGLA